jgi:tetratricopeptide (TPR) repeat protein
MKRLVATALTLIACATIPVAQAQRPMPSPNVRPLRKEHIAHIIRRLAEVRDPTEAVAKAILLYATAQRLQQQDYPIVSPVPLILVATRVFEHELGAGSPMVGETTHHLALEFHRSAPREAEKLYRLALEVFASRPGNKARIAVTAESLGDLYAASGERDRAAKAYEGALRALGPETPMNRADHERVTRRIAALRNR